MFENIVSYLLPLLQSSAPLPSFPADPISSSRRVLAGLCSIPEVFNLVTFKKNSKLYEDAFLSSLNDKLCNK